MCGISGNVNFSAKPACSRTVSEMTRRLAPRGPDGVGLSLSQNVAFGHRRLKIIDLSERSRQPLVDPQLGLTVAFNGCIYNYQELKRELEQAGFHFFSDGDTEVIAKAYACWGVRCVEHLQGMFAFAIHDTKTGKVVLARDRLGIKPLYIIDDRINDQLFFASTLPALLAVDGVDTSLDPVALHHYLSFHSVVPAPRTLLNGIKKVPPATVVEFDATGRRTDHVYWQLEFDPASEHADIGADEFEALTSEALETAVKRRMVADVPVGVLLSGGLDSSLIVGLLAQAGQRGLHTFSVGFDDVNGEKGNEYYYSDIIANHFDTNHHRLHIDSAAVLRRLPDAIAAMSEPMVSHDNIAFYLLAEEVKQTVKVVQSGQGADEVFAGYHWYPPLAARGDALDAYRSVFFDRDHQDMQALLSPRFRGKDHSSAFVDQHFALPGAPSTLDRALRLDTLVMLADDPVKRLDNMTMAAGLEARVPFLDHELVELAARTPNALKLADGGKGILKQIARKVLPHEVIDRPKGYFPVPALKYLEGDIYASVRDALGSARAQARGLFERDRVDELLASPKDHITPLGGSKLWQLGLLEMWLQSNDL